MGKSGIKRLSVKKKKAFSINGLARDIQFVVFDFDGVFTDNRVLVLQDGSEGVFCSRADGLGLEQIKKIGIHVLVLSKEKSPVVTARCNKLAIPCIQGSDDKVNALMLESDRLAIPLKNIAYVGNDINDLECLKIVGLPVAVSDAHPEVLAVSLHITKAQGGYGAVREFCEFLIDTRGKS